MRTFGGSQLDGEVSHSSDGRVLLSLSSSHEYSATTSVYLFDPPILLPHFRIGWERRHCSFFRVLSGLDPFVWIPHHVHVRVFS